MKRTHLTPTVGSPTIERVHLTPTAGSPTIEPQGTAFLLRDDFGGSIVIPEDEVKELVRKLEGLLEH